MVFSTQENVPCVILLQLKTPIYGTSPHGEVPQKLAWRRWCRAPAYLLRNACGIGICGMIVKKPATAWIWFLWCNALSKQTGFVVSSWSEALAEASPQVQLRNSSDCKCRRKSAEHHFAPFSFRSCEFAVAKTDREKATCSNLVCFELSSLCCSPCSTTTGSQPCGTAFMHPQHP